MKDMGNVHIPDNFQKGKIKKIPGPWGFESLSHQTRGFGYLPPLPQKKRIKKRKQKSPWPNLGYILSPKFVLTVHLLCIR